MKLRIVIVANGIIGSKFDLVEWAQQADLLIAADGGAEHCSAFGIVPDVVIGDLDSTSPSLIKKLKEKGKKIISYPVEKDFTDLELALRYAVDQGAGEIIVIGALGARWDMSVANLMLLGADFLKPAAVRLIMQNQEAVLLQAGQTRTIYGEPGEMVSLIPFGCDAHGVCAKGLHFPLDNETLVFAATRGVSNRLSSTEATISISEGLLLCIHQRRTIAEKG